MTKIKFEREQVEAVYADIERRIRTRIMDGELETEADIHDTRVTMRQGMYATFTALASNLAEVWRWSGEIEYGHT